jgi:hypothetical protein
MRRSIVGKKLIDRMGAGRRRFARDTDDPARHKEESDLWAKHPQCIKEPMYIVGDHIGEHIVKAGLLLGWSGSP